MDANLHCLIYNLLIANVFRNIFWYQLILKNISGRYAQQKKGLVVLTENEQMGWRLIKVENCDNLSETYIAESDFTF